MEPKPITLQGRHVRLEPMNTDHLVGLQTAAAHPEMWTWTFPGADPSAIEAWLHAGIEKQAAGTEFPFTTLNADGTAVIGATRFMEIDRAHKRLEIGNTWIDPAHQRTPVNTEAKLLMMEHAFEVLGCNRVQFKTHHRNEASRRAILRIGAVQEGILRYYMIHSDGTRRDSVVFSVLAEEWPEVNPKLLEKLS